MSNALGLTAAVDQRGHALDVALAGRASEAVKLSLGADHPNYQRVASFLSIVELAFDGGAGGDSEAASGHASRRGRRAKA